ncbi:hypothetical protein HGRIS_009177 [Hohenbuehelia grisea]|uniref:Uncharacterized protein n=1 Tax=Hohenbuehelia grisea TaxID=104357 RepID=A0ABR3J0K2_9AGAR
MCFVGCDEISYGTPDLLLYRARARERGSPRAWPPETGSLARGTNKGDPIRRRVWPQCAELGERWGLERCFPPQTISPSTTRDQNVDSNTTKLLIIVASAV